MKKGNKNMKILVTGGTGYIGSHTVVELIKQNHEVIIIDNLSNSKIEVLDSIEKITGKRPEFYKGNVQNMRLLTKIFKENKIDAVIHFAGLKAVGESVAKPLMYYRNNLDSTITLLETMNKFECKNIVFSSSATVYGSPEKLPITEDMPLSTTNPYGATKLMIENILKDLYESDKSWNIIILRYFNPVGSHKSHLIGENPNGVPNNLMPYIVKVATKKLKELSIFGNDYDTPDGTGVRDYIHVIDLAKGHVKAIDKIKNSGILVCNLGTGNGYSVLEMVNTFQKVNNIKVPYKIVERRPGDIAACFADPSYAKKMLDWEAILPLDDMCKDAFEYEVKASE